LITSVVTQCCRSRALPYTLCHVMPWQPGHYPIHSYFVMPCCQGITQWGDSNWFITRQNNRWKYHSWLLLLVFISSSCKLQQSCPNSKSPCFHFAHLRSITHWCRVMRCMSKLGPPYHQSVPWKWNLSPPADIHTSSRLLFCATVSHDHLVGPRPHLIWSHQCLVCGWHAFDGFGWWFDDGMLVCAFTILCL
jgi:hypothetical protein